MSRQRQSRRAESAARRGSGHHPFRRWSWILALSAAALVLVVLVVLVGRSRLTTGSQAGAGPGGLPGPLGGSSVAQDVNTLVGQPAPSFTLTDSEGQSYAVTPGQGKPLVLVFHMGIT